MIPRSHISNRAFAWLVLALVAGCGGGGAITSLRFYDHDPIWHVEDREPIAKPAPRKAGTLRGYIGSRVRTPLLTTLSLPAAQAALDINALGEVPDSSWFENRIGVRQLDAALIARGPNQVAIDQSAALTVLHAGVRADALVLEVRDARGERFSLAFDPVWTPELQTGAQVVVQRLLWAAGYHVPESAIACVRRDQLVIERGAVVSVRYNDDTLLTERDLDDLLVRAPHARDADCWRVVASRHLPGEPIDGIPASGVRDDDENDRIAHQNRRSLRGLRLFYAWLGNGVADESSTLDVWIETDRAAQLGYVMHYLTGFEKAFGALGLELRHEHDGYAAHFDSGYAAAALFSLGLWQAPWEGLHAAWLRGVGRYDAEHFMPGHYSPEDAYAPFLHVDRADVFWAAKIIARFQPEHIRAAVAQAAYTDPITNAYLVATITARQRKLVDHWFARGNPLDDFTLAREGATVRLCARDLLLAYGFAGPAGTRYVVRAYDASGRALGPPRAYAAAGSGVVCTSGLTLGRTRSSYTMLAITTYRGASARAPVIVHLARNPRTRALRVIGVERR